MALHSKLFFGGQIHFRVLRKGHVLSAMRGGAQHGSCHQRAPRRCDPRGVLRVGQGSVPKADFRCVLIDNVEANAEPLS